MVQRNSRFSAATFRPVAASFPREITTLPSLKFLFGYSNGAIEAKRCLFSPAR